MSLDDKVPEKTNLEEKGFCKVKFQERTKIITDPYLKQFAETYEPCKTCDGTNTKCKYYVSQFQKSK